MQFLRTVIYLWGYKTIHYQSDQILKISTCWSILISDRHTCHRSTSTNWWKLLQFRITHVIWLPSSITKKLRWQASTCAFAMATITTDYQPSHSPTTARILNTQWRLSSTCLTHTWITLVDWPLASSVSQAQQHKTTKPAQNMYLCLVNDFSVVFPCQWSSTERQTHTCWQLEVHWIHTTTKNSLLLYLSPWPF